MTFVLTLTAFAVLMVVVTLWHRVPHPLAEIGAGIAVVVLIAWGVIQADLLPLVMAAALALSTVGVRFPLISDGGARRSEAFPRGYRLFAEPARYVTGRIALSWPVGLLELDDLSVRFVTADGQETFGFPVSEIEGLTSKTQGRGDLRFETTTGRHTFAFGREQLNRGDADGATRFWSSTVLERQQEAAGTSPQMPDQDERA